MKENNETTTCDPCERTFEQNINHLVREGEAPSRQERREKEQEVEAAFTEETASRAKEPANDR